VRFSNGGAERQGDQKPDVRGLAIKLLGVPGKKVIPGLEDATTQDFLLIPTPVFAFKNADEFIFFVKAAQSPATLLFKVIGRFGFGRTLRLIKQIKTGFGRKISSLTAIRYWSPVPIQWGAHAAKLSAIPVVPLPDADKLPASPAYLREDLLTRIAAAPVEFDFAIQLYVDPVRTPIEDPSVEWLESDSPYIRVARLVIPRQDLASAEGDKLGAYIEKLSFDPWHAPVEFRPLGDVMRARSAAYRVSGIARGAAPEPVGTELNL
jgi:hypothetical protein